MRRKRTNVNTNGQMQEGGSRGGHTSTQQTKVGGPIQYRRAEVKAALQVAKRTEAEGGCTRQYRRAVGAEMEGLHK